jgi:hypothetical protein
MDTFILPVIILRHSVPNAATAFVDALAAANGQPFRPA